MSAFISSPLSILACSKWAQLTQTIVYDDRSASSVMRLIQPKKDCYKFSFLPKTVIDWNSLDEEVTNIEDTDTFKETIIEHYLNPKPENKKQ